MLLPWGGGIFGEGAGDGNNGSEFVTLFRGLDLHVFVCKFEMICACDIHLTQQGSK